MKWRGGVVDFATRLGDDRRMKHADQTDVVIVGGGLNGPALALALAQAGLRVTVVDARQSQARAEVGFAGRLVLGGCGFGGFWAGPRGDWV